MPNGGIRGARRRVSIELSELKSAVTQLWLDQIELQIKMQAAARQAQILAITQAFNEAQIWRVFNVILQSSKLKSPSIGCEYGNAACDDDDDNPFDFSDFSLPGG